MNQDIPSDYSPYYNQQDVKGFQSKIYQTEQIFGDLKNYELPSELFRSEQIKQLTVSLNQIAVLTASNKIYRMTKKKGWQKLEIPDRIEQPVQQQQQQQVQQNQGNLITNLFSNVFSGVGTVVQGVGYGVGYVVQGVGQILNITDGAQPVIIDRIFLDPFGYHLIACSNQGFSFYINYHHENQMKLLKNVRGEEYIITSIGWEDSQAEQKADSIEHKTKSFILGTSKGVLYIYSIKCLDQEQIEETIPFMALELHSSSTSKAINGIKYLKMYSDNRKDKKFLVFVSTNSSVYAFSDKDIVIHLQNFKLYDYQNRVSFNVNDTSFNNDFRISQNSLLSVCSVVEGQDKKKIPHSLLWVNEYGLFNQLIPTCYEQYKDTFLRDLQKLTFAKQNDFRGTKIDPRSVDEMPIDILLTEFHYILLFYDNLTIMSRINERIVATYDLKSMGVVYGMQYDSFNKIIWIYSSKDIKYLSIQNEEKDGWKLYLEKKQFNLAFDSAKKADVTKEDIAYLAGLYGDQQFSQKDYIKAAQLYFETNRNFEEITIKFLNKQLQGDLTARDGLEEYLTLWLKNLRQDVKTQRHILIYWLIEIKAEKINAQEVRYQYYQQYPISKFKNEQDKRYCLELISQKIQSLKDNLKQLLEQYIHDRDLDENTIYQILQTHGRLKDCFDYARKKQSFEVIIKNDINEDKFDQVLLDLEQIPREKERYRNDLLVKYSHLLIQKETEKFIQKIKDYSIKPYRKESKINKRQQSQQQDTKEIKLVRSLIDTPNSKKRLAIEYLKGLISDNKCDDKTIHNMLILFLSQLDQEFELDEYFSEQEQVKREQERFNFSFEFAFTIANSYDFHIILVKLYGLKDMCSEAIKVALENDLGYLIQSYITQPSSQKEQKKLMLQVAKYYLEKDNIFEVIDLLQQYPALQIEEILDSFSESVDVQKVTEQICNGLEQKNKKIEELRILIKAYSLAADKIKSDLNKINKYVIIKQDKTCRECNRALYTDSFYIFPCKHGFHQNCLIYKVIKNDDDQMKLEKINKLNKQIEQIQKSIESLNTRQRASSEGLDIGLFNNPLNKLVNFVASHAIEEDNEENSEQLAQYQKELLSYRVELDQLLAIECIECGPSIVESIYKKPFNDNIKIADTWKL
ncbi:hypothetical protein ABPG74_012489 [Tetrahymena malaccensis]